MVRYTVSLFVKGELYPEGKWLTVHEGEDSGTASMYAHYLIKQFGEEKVCMESWVKNG